jgi:hypothetical protein
MHFDKSQTKSTYVEYLDQSSIYLHFIKLTTTAPTTNVLSRNEKEIWSIIDIVLSESELKEFIARFVMHIYEAYK